MHFFYGDQHLTKTRAWLVEAWRAGRTRRILAQAYKQLVLWPVMLYRAWLYRVVFIGVTGSCGKTTTKELIAAVLSSQFKGHKNKGNRNLPSHIPNTILRVRPWYKFCVQEIAAGKDSEKIPLGSEKIPLEKPLRLVRPRIGVVTNIGTDHLSAFRTVKAIAAEKAKLIAALPQNGIAVLNADDSLVLAMQARCIGQVMTYGLASNAIVRAENVRCGWPDRLSFTVHYKEQSHAVQTQLCGEHWVPCVLASLAVGIVMGVPLATAVQAIQTVPPFKRRMSPMSHPDGITFIQDDYKAPFLSIRSCTSIHAGGASKTQDHHNRNNFRLPGRSQAYLRRCGETSTRHS